MAKYGIPYQGSKNAIADDIIANLPTGNRLVDLFGGGFAISHCALLSGKWKHVLYNDVNPLLIPLIKGAIEGKYNYENFTPRWISREEFHEKKDTDGYIKYVWSFGNDGATYLYGKNIEEIKHAGHDFCVYGKPIEGIDFQIETKDINERRLALMSYVKKNMGKRFEIQNLESLARLQRVQSLERIELVQSLGEMNSVLNKLEMTCMDYREYQYQDGDVVYCDIPYQNGAYTNVAKNYQTEFSHGDFYTWAVTRPFPVYFSSYKLGGLVWEKEKNVLKSATTNAIKRTEVLYCVDNDYIPKKKYYQGFLFEV